MPADGDVWHSFGEGEYRTTLINDEKLWKFRPSFANNAWLNRTRMDGHVWTEEADFPLYSVQQGDNAYLWTELVSPPKSDANIQSTVRHQGKWKACARKTARGNLPYVCHFLFQQIDCTYSSKFSSLKTIRDFIAKGCRVAVFEEYHKCLQISDPIRVCIWTYLFRSMVIRTSGATAVAKKMHRRVVKFSVFARTNIQFVKRLTTNEWRTISF